MKMGRAKVADMYRYFSCYLFWKIFLLRVPYALSPIPLNQEQSQEHWQNTAFYGHSLSCSLTHTQLPLSRTRIRANPTDPEESAAWPGIACAVSINFRECNLLLFLYTPPKSLSILIVNIWCFSLRKIFICRYQAIFDVFIFIVTIKLFDVDQKLI